MLYHLVFFQGPAFVPSGIFKPAFLVSLSHKNALSSPSSVVSVGPSLFVEEKSVEIYRKGQVPGLPPDQQADWIVNVTLALRTSVVTKDHSMTISFPELKVKSRELPLNPLSGNPSTSQLVSGTFTIPNGVPELWYTHNLGKPK